jgi:hypothetical protein
MLRIQELFLCILIAHRDCLMCTTRNLSAIQVNCPRVILLRLKIPIYLMGFVSVLFHNRLVLRNAIVASVFQIPVVNIKRLALRFATVHAQAVCYQQIIAQITLYDATIAFYFEQMFFKHLDSIVLATASPFTTHFFAMPVKFPLLLKTTLVRVWHILLHR